MACARSPARGSGTGLLRVPGVSLERVTRVRAVRTNRRRAGAVFRANRDVALLLAASLVLRLLLVALTSPYSPRTDSADYHRLGVSLALGDGWGSSIVAPGGGATAFRAPLYPALLGAIYRVGAIDLTLVRVIQALIGTLTVGLVVLVAHQLFGRRVALGAGAIAALSPTLLIVDAALLTEVLSLPLELGAVAAVLAHRNRPDGRALPILAGVLVGLGALTRFPGVLLLLPLGIALATARSQSARRRLVAVGLFGVACLAVITPWTVRNAQELDAFVPVTTQAGFGLAGTYNEVTLHDEANPGAWRVPYLDHTLLELVSVPPGDEVTSERLLRGAALDFAKAHPELVVRATFWNTMRMLHLTDGFDGPEEAAADMGIGPRLARAEVVGSFGLFALAVVGATARDARRAPRWLWLIPLLYAAITVPIIGTFRYRAPIDLYLFLLAGLAIDSAARRFSRGRLSSPATSA